MAPSLMEVRSVCQSRGARNSQLRECAPSFFGRRCRLAAQCSVDKSKVNPKKLNSHSEKDNAICRPWAAGVRGGPRWLRPCSTEDPQRIGIRDPQAAHNYVARNSVRVQRGAYRAALNEARIELRPTSSVASVSHPMPEPAALS
jgi:hypothetical protein